MGFGFSQLAGDGCSVPVAAGDLAPGKPGGDLQKVVPCITPLPSDVLIPMYDAIGCNDSGCKGKGPYPIVGLAVFRVDSYSFNGNNYAGTLGKKCPDSDRGRYCIRGYFTTTVTSQGTPGDGVDFGAYQVYLSS